MTIMSSLTMEWSSTGSKFIGNYMKQCLNTQTQMKTVNLLRLLSELEGSSQMLNLIECYDDKSIIDEMKKKYYKLYFKTKKEELNAKTN